ncbi:MAG: peptide ABC transporter substrate-binding protein [Pseudomonadota bacterium]
MNALSARLAIFLLGSLGLTACSPEPNHATTAAKNSITIGNGGDPGTLDPALAEDTHAFNVLTDLYEGLLVEDAAGNLIPGVASDWQHSEDGLVYTFNLNNGAKWSDGTPVLAGDFVRSIRRVAAPETRSTYSFLLSPIKNFEAIKAGELPVADLGVYARSDNVLEIELARPAGHFLSILAQPVSYPVYGEAPTAAQFTDTENFIGNGAYLLKEWKINHSIKLRKNENFREADSVQIEEVTYIPLSDLVAELNRYRTGEVQITQSIPTSHFQSLKDTMGDELRVAPSLGLYYLAFDLTEAPFDSKPLRQALTMAIDRQQLVEFIGRGEQAAYGLVPPGVSGHESARFRWRELDSANRIDRARQLYNQAGYNKEKPLKLKLSYNSGDIHERIVLAVSGMWQQSLGVEVELEKKEWKFFLATRDDRPSWDIMRFNWIGDYNDPMTFVEIFKSDSPQNLPRYKSPGYDELVEAAAIELDLEKRAQLTRDAEALLLNDSNRLDAGRVNRYS